ncbi:hypothetical protein H4R26_004493 [Coemansia thaxteri]|uniref:GCS light chain n=1 Tax=Coemansia thaxteri TaxID=2663907 RepID=A0A9W8EI48_9FUNG|nr:hypothetical protein H4R26_004493 [Coemansia thaxteri]
MTRRRQKITEKVPSTPRKVVVYTDNLMTSTGGRDATTTGESAKDVTLVISTSFRFDPDLNMLEILDPCNLRNNIKVKGLTNYAVSVKIDELFVSFADITNHIAQPVSATDSDDQSAQPFTEHILADRCSPSDIASNDDSAVACATPPGGRSSSGHVSSIANSTASHDTCDMTRYLKVWRALNRLKESGKAVKVGVCDLSKPQLESLCGQSSIIPDMLQVHVTNDPSEDTNPLDSSLQRLAKKHEISIRTHTDNTGILSDRTFQTLATDFKINERFPTTEVPPQGYKIDFMKPRWVVSYNVTLKNRGLVSNRGYIAMASSDCVLDPNRTSRTVFAPIPNSSSSSSVSV